MIVAVAGVIAMRSGVKPDPHPMALKHIATSTIIIVVNQRFIICLF